MAPDQIVSRRRLAVAGAIAGAVAVLAALAGGSSAGATSARPVFTRLQSAATQTSTNWAGYVVSGAATTYTSVTGTWKEPTVTCGTSDAGDASAFWVGLGGTSSSSQALEQVGTSADCDSETGQPSYYAWYELVPSPSITIQHLKVDPGDVVTTSVNVLGGSTIEVQVKDRTRHTTFTKKLPFASPDLSSADWIAEAPSSCDAFRCRPTALSNFGSIQFSNIAALGNATGGTLTANPGWTTTVISLVPDGSGRGYYPGPDTFAGSLDSTAGATPSTASSDGRSFSVQWAGNAST